MNPILNFTYEQQILLLKQISIDYNIDYNYLIQKYLNYFSSIKIVKNEEIEGEIINIDRNEIKYNKNGFIIK
jgi:hypothetical protein